jgi:tetratricopeptide (TPR) repeat protein
MTIPGICLSFPLTDKTGNDPLLLAQDISEEFEVEMTYLLASLSYVHKADDQYLERGMFAEISGDEHKIRSALNLLRELSPEIQFVERRMVAELFLSTYLAARERNETDEALIIAERAVRFDPEQASFWGNLGNARSASLKFVEADEAFERAYELEPTNLRNLLNWTKTSFEAGHRERLRFCIATIHEIAPESEEFLELLAVLKALAQPDETRSGGE